MTQEALVKKSQKLDRFFTGRGRGGWTGFDWVWLAFALRGWGRGFPANKLSL